MAIGRTNAMGSSDGLNFDVVCSTTQPTNPKENTIWINTSDTYTEFVYDVNPPEVAPGRLWFQKYATYGVSLNVNILKNMNAIFYIYSVQSYTPSFSRRLDAKLYQDGKWSDIYK